MDADDLLIRSPLGRAADDHRIAIVAYDGCQSLDVTGPYEVFAGANEWLRATDSPLPRYALTIVGAGDRRVETGEVAGGHGGEVTVRCDSGLRLGVDHFVDADRGGYATVVVAGGSGVLDAAAHTPTVDWVAARARDAHRVGSVCSGTFVLGAAGLLTGRRVTTHWARGDQLAARHPEAIVDPDPIHVVDGPIWTSAGVTAGIDMALAMVERDVGADCAQIVARHLVMFVRRPGGQSQFATAVWSEPTGHDGIRTVLRHVLAEPGATHRIDTLARIAALSTRHFTRVFTAEVGMTPARYVEAVRVEQARRLLERSDLTVDVVADRCGFGTAETMRRSFLRRVGTPPSAYRARFATAIRREPPTGVDDPIPTAKTPRSPR